MTVRTVSVVVNAITNRYIAEMAKAAAATKAFGASAAATAAKTNVSLGGMTAVAGGLSSKLSPLSRGGSGAAILGLGAIGFELYAASKAAIDFESSFAGIRKTVDGSEADFAELEEGMRGLATQIPVNVNELNRIGEAAGQLGIQKDAIVGFTDTVAKMGVTTNLVSDQAATEMARFANITQMPQDNFDRLGSTIVALGNNLATTESEISEFGLRLAGAGSLAGMTEADILAIGGALSSVGIEAEAGGTAVQKVLLGITDSVNTADERLETFASTAGMSAQEFQAAWQADPGQAFASFVEGLGAAGKDATGILRSLNLTDQRLIRSFLTLAGSGDTLREALELGNDAWEQNSALAEEAGKRFETTASQMQLANNQINEFQITAGQKLTPILGDLAQFFTDVMLASDRQNESLMASVALFDQLAQNVRSGDADLSAFIRNVEGNFDTGFLGSMDAGAESINELRENLLEITTLGQDAGPFQHFTGISDDDIKIAQEALRILEQLDATSLQVTMEAGSTAIGGVGQALSDAVGSTAAFGSAQGDAAGKAAGLTGELSAQADALMRLKGASGFLGIEGASLAAARAQQRLAEAQAAVDEALRSGGRRSKAYKDAILGLREAQLSSTEAQISMADAVQSYIEKVKSGEVSQSEAIRLVKEYGRMAGLTKDDIAGMIDRIREAKAAYDALPESKRTRVLLEGEDAVLGGLRAIGDALAGIDRFVTTTVNVRTVRTGGYSNQVQHSGGMAGTGAMRYGPHLRSDEYPTILQRGEVTFSKADVRQMLLGGNRGPQEMFIKSGRLEIPGLGPAILRNAEIVVDRAANHEDSVTRTRQPLFD